MENQKFYLKNCLVNTEYLLQYTGCYQDAYQ